jgi:hypothetical protein
LQSSILHSAITAHHRGGSNNPTIASLLHSSPGIPAPGVSSVAPPPVTVSSSLKNLVTSAIGAAGGEDMPKPSSTSPAAGESSDVLFASYVGNGICSHTDLSHVFLCIIRIVPCHNLKNVPFFSPERTLAFVFMFMWFIFYVNS